MAFQSDQPDQRRVAFLLLGVLDQQRRGNFARGRKQLVVSVDFVLNRFALRHFLGPDHLLDLVPRSLRVLEQKRQMRPDMEPISFLLMNKQGAQPLAHASVIAQRKYFVESDRLQSSFSLRRELCVTCSAHLFISSPCNACAEVMQSVRVKKVLLQRAISISFLTLTTRAHGRSQHLLFSLFTGWRGHPCRLYARAITSSGCIGRTPVACSICTAASGQSGAITCAPASRIPAQAFSPHFIESAKNSFFIAQVPSCAVHASTVVTSTPGIWRIRSRERNPMPCALRWHGT